jgi:ABC-type transport system substrate-binding protein
MSSPAQPFFDDIVGAKDMLDGKTTTLAGVTANADTLQITLEQPTGDFLARLAMPFACPLPLSTPLDPDGIGAPVPSAGPYFIDVWEPKLRIVLKKNPGYGGDRPRRFDEIQYTIGFPLATIRLRVESGESDHAGDGVPPVAHAELAPLYGPGSPAAAAGKQRWFAHPSAAFRYFAFNHDRPLFGGPTAKGNVPLKQAINHAIDRTAMIDQRGAHAGVITDQYIAPAVPGFTDAALYPERPDVNKARELADGHTRSGEAIMYCANTSPAVETCQIAEANLAAIGIDVEIMYFPRAVQFTKTRIRGEPFDITFDGWHVDYLDPYDFLFLLDGTTIGPANNVNFAYFNDPAFNDQLHAANLLAGEERYAALGALDVEVARDSAPLAAFINDNTRQFFSERVGCHVYHPTYELDLAMLCLRPEIPVTDAQVGEGAGAAAFTVTLSNAEASSVTVGYTTVDGTARAGEDYAATAGTLTFSPGDQSETVAVPILEDGTDESDETFAVTLTSASKGTPTGGGNATILDNDAPPPAPPAPPPPPPAAPPAPPPPPPPAPVRRVASAGIAAGTVVVSSNGVAPIRVRCGGARCRGSVVLFASVPAQSLAPRKLRLGSARFSIPAGRTATVRVRLNRPGLKRLKQAKRLKVQAVVTVGKKVTRRTIMLRAPRRR